MASIAIYPGTFDPMTFGHLDIAQRATHLFDKVIIAVASNMNKHSLLDVASRVELIRQVVADNPKIEVANFSGLLVDYAKSCQASVIIRGVRAVADFEYEFQLARMNRDLSPNIETIVLLSCEKYGFVSSTLVREIALLGGEIDKFVPPIIKDALIKTIKSKQ